MDLLGITGESAHYFAWSRESQKLLHVWKILQKSKGIKCQYIILRGAFNDS